jgi:hypothetical protein
MCALDNDLRIGSIPFNGWDACIVAQPMGRNGTIVLNASEFIGELGCLIA